MNLHPLAGVYAASLTPLKSDYSVDQHAIPEYLEFLVDQGCHGALLLGTTGEGTSFSPAERIQVMRAASAIKQRYPDFKLLAGTGTPSLSETIDLNRAAFEFEFDAVVTLPPYYFRAASDQGLFHWFDLLIQQSVPEDKFLLGYHIPGMAGIGFSIELLARLKERHPRRFAGIKDSSHNIDLITVLGETFGKELLVLNGTDSYFLKALGAHAGGCITAPANLITPDLRAVWDAVHQGTDPAPAQKRVTRAREILEQFMPFPPLLKALVAKQFNKPLWSVRPPLEPAAPEKIAQALDLLT